jgi:eukaryotic-like serine/threonine-protein kinase
MAFGQDTRSFSGLVRFGVFEADLRAGELRKNGLKIRLAGQPFEVLAMMLERPGEVVTREELQKRLWPDGTFVDFDHSLNKAVNKIREALGDSAESPRFVETLARRGYRFIAPLERLDQRGTPTSADANGRSSLRSDESRTVEPSSEVSGNETVLEPHAASSPATLNTQPWFVQRGKLLAAGLVLSLLLVAFFWWFLRRPKPRGLVLTRLTSDRGLTTDAVISPDGKLIAFASDRGGSNLDIWVKQVAGGDPIQLTRDPADDHQPAFSADGGQIVFRSEREGGGIYVVSALGGEARLLAQKGRNPRFSPAGDWIAYWVGPVAGHPFGAQAGRIFLILPSGAPKPIDPPGIRAAGCPIWSPDGTHLLFYGSDSTNVPVWYPTSDWWVWPLAGGSPVKTGAFAAFAAQNLSLNLPSPVPAPAEWIDDQVYFSAKTGDSVNLWQVSISAKDWRITGPAQPLTTGSGLEIRPSFARSGLLVFSSLVENADIWSLPIDASQGQVKGDLEQITRDLAADYSPSMSADGKKLAFVSRRSGNADIWVKDLESGKEKPSAESPVDETASRISPDGSFVSYAIPTPGTGSLDIYVLPAKGGLLQKLCDGCGIPLGWSPDNRLLFHGDDGGRATIDRADVAAGKADIYLQSSHLALANADLTHDGRWITFNGFDHQASLARLQVLAARFQLGTPPNESDWIKVVSDPHYNDKPRWSPDGNRIYFVSDRDGFACLWSQPVEPKTKRPAGPPLPLYHIHQVRRSILNVGWGLMDIAVAPDKIVLNLSEITGNIWMTKLAEDQQK